MFNKKNKNPMPPLRWRRKHPRCKFCHWLKYDSTASRVGLSGCDYYFCQVKDKIIHNLDMPRSYCKCFKVKHIKELEVPENGTTNDLEII